MLAVLSAIDSYNESSSSKSSGTENKREFDENIGYKKVMVNVKIFGKRIEFIFGANL